MTWILAAIFVVFLVRHLWKIYCHRSNVLTRQAANMNWVATGRVKSDTGGYDMLLSRGGYTVRLSWRDGIPTMILPPVKTPFADFLEIERWIFETEKRNPDNASAVEADDPYVIYGLKVLDVINRQDEAGIEDLYATILAMRASNHAYFTASSGLIRTGYEIGTDPFLIGMMHVTAIINALEVGQAIDSYSVDYLYTVEANLLTAKYAPSAE